MRSSKIAEIFRIAHQNTIDAAQIGVISDTNRIKIGSSIDLDVNDIVNIYNEAIEKKMPIEQN